MARVGSHHIVATLLKGKTNLDGVGPRVFTVATDTFRNNFVRKASASF